MRPNRTRLLFAIGFLSAALIAFQLVLMQILSVVQWYHFGYMVISVALLGFGASGTMLALTRSWLVQRADHVVPMLMIFSGIAMSVAVAVSQTAFFRFDSYLLFVERGQLVSLLLTYLLFFIPFFVGALAIGLVFVQHSADIGAVYAANLLGSGAGGLVIMALLWVFAPQQLSAIVGLMPICAGMLILPQTRKGLVAATSLTGLALAAFMIAFPPKLHLSQYKSLSRTLDLPDAEVVFEKNSPHGLLQVVSSPALRHAPSLSLTYDDTIPATDVVFNNGDWYGPVVHAQREERTQLLRFSTFALPFEMNHCERVLVLQSGTGSFVAQAVERGAAAITAVERHPDVIHLLRDVLVEQTDSLFHHPSVQLVAQEPRSFLLGDTAQYDLVVLPTLDMFGGSGGVYAIQEQYLLTKQAFSEAWERLAPDGMLCISSWVDYPLRNPLRAYVTIVETLEDEGVTNQVDHIAAVRSWGTVTFVAKRTPLTGEEIARVRAFCDVMLFDPALLPDIKLSERNTNNVLNDSTLLVLLDRITADTREESYSRYDFNIRPVTDDSPYFSQFLSWRSVPRLGELFGRQTVPFIELASFIILLTLIQIAVLAIALTILPLIRTRKIGRERAFVFFYFASIGTGYMFVEMILIQRFVLFLGQPIYAAGAVIAAMLLFSGWGSSISSKLQCGKSAVSKTLTLIAMLIVVYGVLITPVLIGAASASIPVKMLLTGCVIAPLAFFMGMPFPLGMRFVRSRNENTIPWAWGVNGCASVIAVPLATLLAIEIGFLAVMVCATGAYAVAAVSARLEQASVAR